MSKKKLCCKSEKEHLARAEKVIKAHAEAVKKGRGAVAIDGRMVDNATIRLAEQLWQTARHLGLD